MLRTPLLHPQLLAALGSAGHGSTVLIADGNYPFCTRSHEGATRVFLNLAPGKLLVTEVLAALAPVIMIEGAEVMLPESGAEPPIFEEFRELLRGGPALGHLGRQEFYDAACRRDLCLLVATGDQRLYANLLLTLGAVTP